MNLLILVVDDEPDVEVLLRQQFRRDLRDGRFSMEFAQSGPMALQRIADAGDRSLILILSDINMPGMSGLELLPKAKAARPDVPIIMITAYGDAETKRQALANGAEALLIKPIDFKTLRSEIDMRVERIAPEKSPLGTAAVIIIRPRQGGADFKYTIPMTALARLGPMNKDLDPRGRYDAVMAADGLFQVKQVQ